MKVQYIVLEYCPEVRATTGRKIAVVARSIECVQEQSLVIYTARDWSKNIDPEDDLYIRDVLEDAGAKPPDESHAIFLSMTKMASGVLRATEQGFCEDSHLAVISGIDIETCPQFLNHS